MANELWVVRAGQQARYLDLFRSAGLIAVGFEDVADEDLLTLGEAALMARAKGQSAASGVGQLRRFAFQIETDDLVITPGPPGGNQRYFVGRVTGPYRHSTAASEEGPHQRAVQWVGSFTAEDISKATRASLDAATTLFEPKQGEAELRAVLSGLDKEGASLPSVTPRPPQPSPLAQTSPRSRVLAPAELDVSLTAAGRALIRAHHPALEMEQTPRHLDPGAGWDHVPGVYILTGIELDTSTTRTGIERALTTTLVSRPWAYVGLTENVLNRLASHRQNKPEWR